MQCSTWLGIAIAVLVWSAVGVAQQESDSMGVADLDDRLARLSPDDPMTYFDLAEELAYERPQGVTRELAQRLFVLSAAIDAGSSEPLGLTPSVCIALAELSTDAEERRWLKALGEATNGVDRRPLWRLRPEVQQTDDTPEQFAKAMGLFRSGDGAMMRSMLRRVDGEALLRDAGMEPDSAIAVSDEIERLTPLMRPSGPGRDGRVVRTVRSGQQFVEIDPETGGNPGPDLSSTSYFNHLRAEVMLLGGKPETWSAQLVLERGRPFRDLDPDELSKHFGVDVRRKIWRKGGSDSDWTGGSWVTQ